MKILTFGTCFAYENLGRSGHVLRMKILDVRMRMSDWIQDATSFEIVLVCEDRCSSVKYRLFFREILNRHGCARVLVQLSSELSS